MGETGKGRNLGREILVPEKVVEGGEGGAVDADFGVVPFDEEAQRAAPVQILRGVLRRARRLVLSGCGAAAEGDDSEVGEVADGEGEMGPPPLQLRHAAPPFLQHAGRQNQAAHFVSPTEPAKSYITITSGYRN